MSVSNGPSSSMLTSSADIRGAFAGIASIGASLRVPHAVFCEIVETASKPFCAYMPISRMVAELQAPRASRASRRTSGTDNRLGTLPRAGTKMNNWDPVADDRTRVHWPSGCWMMRPTLPVSVPRPRTRLEVLMRMDGLEFCGVRHGELAVIPN